MKQVIDHFSTGGADYAKYRPDSPQAIYDFLYSHVKHFDTAWDCGTGSGQVADRLAERFKTVYGTDISEDQLQHAIQKDNIIYRKERAEQTSFADQSIDLITVAQAIHWLDFEPFYAEVKRVAKPGAFFAAWTYTLLDLTPELNEVIRTVYMDITKDYWDDRRALVDAEYKTIPFPLDEVEVPEIWTRKNYTLPQLLGYLRTWSASIKYIQKEGKDPLAPVLKDLERAWGSAETQQISWPIHVRAGYVR